MHTIKTSISRQHVVKSKTFKSCKIQSCRAIQYSHAKTRTMTNRQVQTDRAGMRLLVMLTDLVVYEPSFEIMCEGTVCGAVSYV